MRIVVDTNVIASAVYFGGKPYDLLKLIMDKKVSAIASKEIVDEYEEILARLQHKFPKLSKSIPFQEIVGKLTVIKVSSDIRICRDSEDDKFISKRTLLDIFHDIAPGYLQNYLNEFCWKFNRRYFGEALFDRLVVTAASYKNDFRYNIG